MWGSAVRVCPGLRIGGMGDWLSWLEHRLCKPGVVGSSPTFSTRAPHWAPDGSLTGWEREEQRRERDRRPAGAPERGETSNDNYETHERPGGASRPGEERRRGPRARARRRASDIGRTGDAYGSQRRRRARQAAKGRGEARAAMDPRAPEWGNPPRGRRGIRRMAEANPVNRNIQVAGGKENNSDPPSSGERKGASPNRGRRGAPGVVGPA